MLDAHQMDMAVQDKKGPLYANRTKIHPKAVKGAYRRLKDYFLWVGLVLYHLTPLLRWERGEGKTNQAILFDISGQRIYLFGLEVWPQDIYILTGVMILAAVGLFFSAALWGRAWCGFACFQTLWTDLFMKVEALIEGDRNARLRMDKAPLSAGKMAKRVLKHGVWLLISTFFALSFLWYFDDAFVVTQNIIDGDISGWILVTFLTLLGMTYLMAGLAREQVCLYMCPYGRFQGVMVDEHSKLVTYEDWRGEARQKPGKERDFTNRGHCVDCTLCVQVCPTGVDIREGNQMGCIGCGLCIDACDSMMEKFELPKKLISYDSQHHIAQRAGQKPVELSKPALLRARSSVYLSILLVTAVLTLWGFSAREMTKLTVLKDRAPFYVRLSSGDIQNAYTVRILNKEDQKRTLRLNVQGDFQPELKLVGQEGTDFNIEAASVVTFRVYVKANSVTEDSQPLIFEVLDVTSHEATQVRSVFHGPS
ncbi:Protein RdxA [Candidatus Terasakiella magnetica]|uniref:Protein RdxA n=1 Tax=Candidatus Terasakiella magnetica TaxID=1867952 RepID=A0A1C3RLA1_9PROT|nr:cytochrome c oxidase accessory protein CcoG [Candidatus Terasakiella magnetica]SCA57959.1 Protein RdxA [Candidatus Terasakiella magnetica]